MSNTRLFSFGKSLFFGALPEDVIFPYPRLSRQEQERTAKLLTQLSELSREAIDPRQIDEQEQIPSVVLQRLAALGVMGLNIPAQYGGQALSMTSACRVLDAVGSIDGSLAVTIGAHLGLCAGAVAQFGSESQRQLYLPRLASGQVLGSFASSEPTSGSDTAAIRTRARQDGEEFVLNGSKLWVQNGGLAQLFVLFAQTQVVREGQHRRPGVELAVLVALVQEAPLQPEGHLVEVQRRRYVLRIHDHVSELHGRDGTPCGPRGERVQLRSANDQPTAFFGRRAPRRRPPGARARVHPHGRARAAEHRRSVGRAQDWSKRNPNRPCQLPGRQIVIATYRGQF